MAGAVLPPLAEDSKKENHPENLGSFVICFERLNDLHRCLLQDVCPGEGSRFDFKALYAFSLASVSPETGHQVSSIMWEH